MHGVVHAYILVRSLSMLVAVMLVPARYEELCQSIARAYAGDETDVDKERLRQLSQELQHLRKRIKSTKKVLHQSHSSRALANTHSPLNPHRSFRLQVQYSAE